MTELDTADPPATPFKLPTAVWWPLIGAVALIAAAYVGDMLVGAVIELFLGQYPLPDFIPIAPVQMLARLVTMALLLVLAWIVFRGPRGRLAGAATVAVGLYFPLATLIWLGTHDSPTPVILPLLPLRSGWNDLVAWTSAGVIVLGAAMIIWPTADTPPSDR